MRISAATLLSLAMIAPAANTATFCAGNTVELSNALATAQSNGADDTIFVSAGSIPSPVGGFSYWAQPSDVNRTLDIIGGWTPGCVTQTFSSTLTQLTGGDARPIMKIVRGSGTLGELRIRRVQFRNGFSDAPQALSAYGVALNVNSNQHAGPTLIEHCVFTANTMVQPLAAVYVLHKGTLTFRNNLVAGNMSFNGLSGVAIQTLANATAAISGNTITANGSVAQSFSTLGLELTTGANGAQFVSNNIVWGNNSANVPRDIQADNGTALISNNYAGLVAGGGTLTSGNVNLNPQFVAGSYRLGTASPLRDMGNNAAFGGLGTSDLDGNSRVRNTVVDLGAYEAIPETIFKGGFE